MVKSTKAMATPNERDAPGVDTHPYMVELKPACGEDPAFYGYPSGARNAILRRLNNQRVMWERLANVEGMMAVDDLIEQAGFIGDEGGVVSGVVDPFTGMKFHAEVIRRKSL